MQTRREFGELLNEFAMLSCTAQELVIGTLLDTNYDVSFVVGEDERGEVEDARDFANAYRYDVDALNEVDDRLTDQLDNWELTFGEDDE